MNEINKRLKVIQQNVTWNIINFEIDWIDEMKGPNFLCIRHKKISTN